MDDAEETVTLACAAIAQARTGRELGDVWGSWAGTLAAAGEWATVEAAHAWWEKARELALPDALRAELRRAGKSPPEDEAPPVPARPSSSAPGALLEGPSADAARAPTEPPGPMIPRDLRAALEYALREADLIAGELEEVADEQQCVLDAQRRLHELVSRVRTATGLRAEAPF